MWRRSQVEKLTGMSKRAIQQLCNPNEATGGLGLWHPCDIGPGRAAYDETDLLAFTLMGRWRDAGFALTEMRSAMEAITNVDCNEGDQASYQDVLQAKQERLRDELRTCELRLALLGALDVPGPCLDPRERLEKALDGWVLHTLCVVLRSMESEGDARAAECLRGVEAACQVEGHEATPGLTAFDGDGQDFLAAVTESFTQEPGVGALLELAARKELPER